MKLKINSILREVAEMKGQEPEAFAADLYTRLLAGGVIKETSEYWGRTLDDIVPDSDKFLAEYKLPAIACEILVFGDGDCPNCGCWLKEDVLDSEVDDPGDYNTPPTYRETIVEHYCKWCGFSKTEDMTRDDFDELAADDKRYNL